MRYTSNYVHREDSSPCPICKKLIKPRGMGRHIQLMHADAQEAVKNQLSMLSEEPEAPKREIVSKAPRRVQKAMDPTATQLVLLGAAMYFLYRLAKIQAKTHTLSEGGKPTQRAGKIMLR